MPAVARLLAAVVALATIAHPMIVAPSSADDDTAVCEGGGPAGAPTQGDQPDDGSGADQDDSSDGPTVAISTQHDWDRPARCQYRSIVSLPAGPSLGRQGCTRIEAPLPIPPDAALTTEVRSRSQMAAPQRPHAPPYLP